MSPGVAPEQSLTSSRMQAVHHTRCKAISLHYTPYAGMHTSRTQVCSCHMSRTRTYLPKLACEVALEVLTEFELRRAWGIGTKPHARGIQSVAST